MGEIFPKNQIQNYAWAKKFLTQRGVPVLTEQPGG